MNLPLGYRYSTLYAGIRKAMKDDLALVVSQTPASAAAVFTRNRLAAAPVELARQHLQGSQGRVTAILTNAGNANCATRTGRQVAEKSCRALARLLGCPADQVIPASTGVIGVELDVHLLTRPLPDLVSNLREDQFEAFADAILTTDLVRKTAFAEVKAGRDRVRLAGATKGSGMIQPNMATTLGYVFTDAQVSPGVLKKILKPAINRSFNAMSVDGDTSTNDMVIVLANGASGVKPDLDRFAEALEEVLASLAQQIARDGEGAKKLVTIDVSGAASDADALRLARTIANSPLVKTALAGADPNWGRVIMAAGNSGVAFDPTKVDISWQGTLVCKNGLAHPFSEDELKQKLQTSDIHMQFRIRGEGPGRARFWTCDLTEGYIHINASYRT